MFAACVGAASTTQACIVGAPALDTNPITGTACALGAALFGFCALAATCAAAVAAAAAAKNLGAPLPG
jgi:hypothetical protein